MGIHGCISLLLHLYYIMSYKLVLKMFFSAKKRVVTRYSEISFSTRTHLTNHLQHVFLVHNKFEGHISFFERATAIAGMPWGGSAHKVKNRVSISFALQGQLRPCNDPKTSLIINQNYSTNQKRSRIIQKCEKCDFGST
jgi:hypothetical protein